MNSTSTGIELDVTLLPSRRGLESSGETDVPLKSCGGLREYVCYFCRKESKVETVGVHDTFCPPLSLGWKIHFPNPHTMDCTCPACASKAQTWEQAKANRKN